MHKLILSLLVILFSGSALSEGTKSISIELLTSSQEEVDTLSATAFGVSLAGALEEEIDVTLEPNGIYKPTFKILVSAFSSQIQIWRELEEKNDRGSIYMDQLILVDDSGFLDEYVWLNHSSIISDAPGNMNTVGFEKWSLKNIPKHEPRIEAQLSLHE